ncbi:MAG: RND transporter [Lysobacteraceae bacterium]|nr:MAG: RND transporter [Xanthomonadaceae bacterium]
MNIFKPAILAACGFLTVLAASAQAPGGGEGPPPSPVRVDRVISTEIVPTVPITGTLFSRNDMQITAAVDGQLTYVAEPGTAVKAGDVVATIDTRPLQLQLEELEAQARRASSQLDYLEKQVERERNLVTRNSTAATQLEQTLSNRDIAASDLAIARSRIQQTQDQLNRSSIKAGFDGVVTARVHREGETVGRGTVLGRMTDTESLEVRVLAPLHHAGRVRVNDELRLFGFESSFTGIVRSVVPPVDSRTQAMELRIDLPPEARFVWSLGQLVSVAVPLRSAKDTLAVNRDALILRQDGTYVYRVRDDGTAERVAVQTGESSGEFVAVSGELGEGDQVVVRGGETLSDGQAVSVIDVTAS